MKKETVLWLSYASENLEVAQLLLKSQYFNPCLQNVQQAIEKVLKAALIERGIGLMKSPIASTNWRGGCGAMVLTLELWRMNAISLIPSIFPQSILWVVFFPISSRMNPLLKRGC